MHFYIGLTNLAIKMTMFKHDAYNQAKLNKTKKKY